MDINWAHELVEQLDWHWQQQLRPRLTGLTDEEYLWEPVANAWSLRPRGDARGSHSTGGGDLVLEYELPEPTPVPVTTIAWRMAHLSVAVFGGRVAGHFGGPPVDYDTFEYADTAVGALRQLDEAYAAWDTGVKALDDRSMAEPCGPSEGPFADAPMAMLVLHINREVVHHGAEIALLRDLFANRSG